LQQDAGTIGEIHQLSDARIEKIPCKILHGNVWQERHGPPYLYSNDFCNCKKYKRIKEEGNIVVTDAIQGFVVQQLVDDENTQEELAQNCLQELDILMNNTKSDDLEEVL
jgi:hypothetical protein